MANAARKPDVVARGIIRNHEKFTKVKNPELSELLRTYAVPTDPGHNTHIRQAMHRKYPQRGLDLTAVILMMNGVQMGNPQLGYTMGIALAEHMVPFCKFRAANSRTHYIQDQRPNEIINLAKAYQKEPTADNRRAIESYVAHMDSHKRRPYNRYALDVIKELHRGRLGYSLLHAIGNAHDAMETPEQVQDLIDKVANIFWLETSRIQHPEGF